jgi:hypothetical protein
VGELECDKEADVRKGWIAVVVLTMALVASACNEGNDEGGSFDLVLSSDAEVCDGDTCGGDGSGEATVEINSDQNEVCYEITLQNVEGVIAAHIHEGDEGEAGDVVVDLQYTGDEGETCIQDLDEGDLEDISEEPSDYYLNVHSEEYPDGAARAQLGS